MTTKGASAQEAIAGVLESESGRKGSSARMQWVGRDAGFVFQSEDLHFVSEKLRCSRSGFGDESLCMLLA